MFSLSITQRNENILNKFKLLNANSDHHFFPSRSAAPWSGGVMPELFDPARRLLQDFSVVLDRDVAGGRILGKNGDDERLVETSYSVAFTSAPLPSLVPVGHSAATLMSALRKAEQTPSLRPTVVGPFALGLLLEKNYFTEKRNLQDLHPRILAKGGSSIDYELYKVLSRKSEVLLVPVLIGQDNNSSPVVSAVFNYLAGCYLITDDFINKLRTINGQEGSDPEEDDYSIIAKSFAQITRASAEDGSKTPAEFIAAGRQEKEMAKLTPMFKNVMWITNLAQNKYLDQLANVTVPAARKSLFFDWSHFNGHTSDVPPATRSWFLATALILTPQESMWERRKIAFLALYKSKNSGSPGDANIFQRVADNYPVFRGIVYYL